MCHRCLSIHVFCTCNEQPGLLDFQYFVLCTCSKFVVKHLHHYVIKKEVCYVFKHLSGILTVSLRITVMLGHLRP